MKSDIIVGIKGGGDLASGVAWRLHHCGFKIFITEVAYPNAVRRKVSFCEAIYEGNIIIEEIEAVLINDPNNVYVDAWSKRKIPVLIDPYCETRHLIKPDVIVDAIMSKTNVVNTKITDAPLVIALGPGFRAEIDAHVVIETNRGHNLGKLITSGCAESDTGIPGVIQGYSIERLLCAPVAGTWITDRNIGDKVKKNELIGYVLSDCSNDILKKKKLKLNNNENLSSVLSISQEKSISNINSVHSQLDGLIRGLLRSGVSVYSHMKIGDIDSRIDKLNYCYTISDKSRAISGSVLEAILRKFYNK